jgi:four helix bundle protein
MTANRYQDLVAWQRAMALVQGIYAATATFPREELFGLQNQMRRSAVSVPSNIAEGQGRSTRGEFYQFLGHARGSLYEIETQITSASKLGYFSSDERDSLLLETCELGRVLNGLMNSVKPVIKPVFRVALTTDN